MKNNTSLFLAISAVKKDKKNYLLSFLIMLIAFTFTITFISIINTNETVDRKEREQKYGNWVICLENLSEKSVDFLKINHSEDLIGDMGVISKLHTNHYVGNYDETFFQLASIELVEGKLPSKSDEVISIQGKNKLGDQVTIDDHQYQVVGIINEYNQYWEGPSFDYFTYDLPTDRNFVYYSSSQESVYQYVDKNNTKITYNYPLIPGKYVINNFRIIAMEDMIFNSSLEDSTEALNYFVALIGVALFVAVFYNIQEREKAVFLLRCLGMSKSDMKKYVYYEMIVVTLIALGISIVVGMILSLFVSLYYYYQTQVFVYTTSLWLSMKYILFIIALIVGVTYLSLLTITLHAMDGLIHRVQRKKMKKYSRHKYMSVYRLANRIFYKRLNLFAPICLLMIVQFLLVTTIIDDTKNLPTPHKVPNYYRYNFDYYDEDMIQNIQDEIIEFNTTKYVDEHGVYYHVKKDEVIVELIKVFDDPLEIQDRLLEGRLPKTKKECVYIYRPNRWDGNESIKIGDTIRVTKDSNEETEVVIENGEEYEKPKEEFYDEFKVVGIALMDEIYAEYEQDQFIGWHDSAIATYADCFDKDEISISTNLVTKHDMFLEINDYLEHDQDEGYKSMYFFTSVDNTTYRQDVFYSVIIMIPLLLTCIVFIYFIMNVLLNKINKDVKHLRCLGMTMKQTMTLYLWNAVHMFGYYAFFMWLLWDMIRPSQYMLLFVIAGLNIVVFVIWAYKKTENTLTFYPTEVERYY